MGNGARQRARTTFNPDAATRTARHRGRPAASIARLLADGQEVVSPETGQRYLKLMEIKRLREKGQRITLLNEAQFRRLAAKAAPGRSR